MKAGKGEERKKGREPCLYKAREVGCYDWLGWVRGGANNKGQYDVGKK